MSEALQRKGAELSTTFNAELFAGAFLEWIADRADTTQEAYKVAVRCFLEWLAGEGETRPTRDTIIKYKRYLETPHASRRNEGATVHYTADTAARYFRGCKMLFAFLESAGLYKDVTKGIRGPKTRTGEYKRDSFDREDVLQILNSIDRSTEAGKRNYSMILLSVTCGFRIIELQRANIGDIETVKGEARIKVQGKGHASKDDFKKIPAEALQPLTEYVQSRNGLSKDSPLFAACGTNARKGGGRLTEPSISRIIKQVVVNAGYNSERLTAHSLRHTSITLDRIAGASLDEARRHARHSSVTTTERYDHKLEKETATDEARILAYLFNGEKTDAGERAADLIARMSTKKQQKAIELLEAMAD